MKNIIVFLSLFIFSSELLAAPLATTLFVKGEVTFKTASGDTQLRRGTRIDSVGTITTTAKAKAKIRYSNGTVVDIGSSTSYTILKYAPEQSEVIVAKLDKGSIHSETSGSGKKELLKTPVVVLAILGTEYYVYVPNNTTTNVKVVNGTVTAVALGELITGGTSVQITPFSVSPKPFPPKGFELLGQIEISHGELAELIESLDASEVSTDSTDTIDPSGTISVTSGSVGAGLADISVVCNN